MTNNLLSKKIQCPDIYLVQLVAIIFLQFSGFYLIDSESIPTTDLALVIEALLFLTVYIRYPGKIGYRYASPLLFAIVIAAIASLTALQNYHQPFFMGFRALRGWYGTLLLYFPLRKLLAVNRINTSTIIKLIIYSSVLYVIVCSMQYVAGGSLSFVHLVVGSRYGDTRIWADTSLPTLSYFLSLAYLLKKGKKNLSDVALHIVVLVFMIGFCVVVLKARMLVISLALATLVAVVLQRNVIKQMFTGLGFGAVIVGALTTEMGADIVDMAIGQSSSQPDTSLIREQGRRFYLEHATRDIQSFLFGNGFPNITVPGVSDIAGISLGYNFNDNGIFGLMYLYGITFVVWMIWVHFVLMRDAIKAGLVGPFCWLISGLFGLMTLYPYCYSDFSTVVCFPIVCTLIEQNLKHSVRSGQFNQA